MSKKYFKIYNKSSERMDDISDGAVDFILTSPPYNIGTKYGNFADSSNFEAYKKTLAKIIGECYRVQKSRGIFIVEVADSIKIDNNYIQLAALFQSIALKSKYYLIGREVNFILTKKHRELPDHGFKDDYSTTLNAHSNCHQILIFSKKNLPFRNGEVHYINYSEFTGDHPCPTPKEMLNFILSRYFKKGQTVLDPFMGTANLGKEVLHRGGNFYGYEIDKGFYKKALAKLENRNKKK